MFCQKCGSQIPDGARFCPNCGFNGGNQSAQNDMPAQSGFPAQMQPTVPARQPMPTETKSKKTGVIIGAVAGGVVIIVLAVVLLVVLLGKGGSKDTIVDQNGGGAPGNNSSVVQDNGASQQEYTWKPAKRLGSDYQSGQVQINGVIYGDLPILGSEFLKQGWTIKNSWDIGAVLEPDDTRSVTLISGPTEIIVEVGNYSSESMPIENCYFYGIRISSAYPTEGTFVLPGGLTIMTSTYEDVISKWGKPSYDGVAMGSKDISYTIGNYEDTYKYILNFNDNNVAISFWLLNENKPSYIASQQSAGSNQDTATPAADEDEEEPYYQYNDQQEARAFVDLSALKSIENKDKCPVKITEHVVIDDYYKGKLLNIGEVGDDACVFTISNKSGSNLKEVTFLAVAYNDNDEPVKIGGTFTFYGYDKYVLQFTTQDVTIASGESAQIGTRCDAGEFSGVSAIVYSYTTADGVEHINDTASQWYQSVYKD